MPECPPIIIMSSTQPLQKKDKLCRKCLQKGHRTDSCAERAVYRADPYKPLSDKEVIKIHVQALKKPLTAVVKFYSGGDSDEDSS